jgi:uncharacterized phage protein (TIGR02220 family)
MPFVKLDCKILDKSIWRESAETCKVWITLLAMADLDGLVEASIDGISDRAKISLIETELAVNKFMAPDPHSTNPANEGRRIERVIGGFQVLNYEVYRQKDHTAAARMRKHREALRVTGVTLQRVYASASEVLSYLNLKTGKKYKNTKYIQARLMDGITVDQLKGIIDTKLCDQHFIDNSQHMNPVTLFRPSHIDNYLNQTPQDFHKKTTHERIRPNTEDAQPPSREERIEFLRSRLSENEQQLTGWSQRQDKEGKRLAVQVAGAIKNIKEQLAELQAKGER